MLFVNPRDNFLSFILVKSNAHVRLEDRKEREGRMMLIARQKNDVRETLKKTRRGGWPDKTSHSELIQRQKRLMGTTFFFKIVCKRNSPDIVNFPFFYISFI